MDSAANNSISLNNITEDQQIMIVGVTPEGQKSVIDSFDVEGMETLSQLEITDTSPPVSGSQIEIETSVRGDSEEDGPLEDTVELVVDGETVDSENVSIEPGENKEVTLTWDIPANSSSEDKTIKVKTQSLESEISVSPINPASVLQGTVNGNINIYSEDLEAIGDLGNNGGGQIINVEYSSDNDRAVYVSKQGDAGIINTQGDSFEDWEVVGTIDNSQNASVRSLELL